MAQRRAERTAMPRTFGFLALVAAAGCALGTHTSSAQEPYPSRTVKIVIPSAPGSTTDTLARLVADQLGQTWGKADDRREHRRRRDEYRRR